MSFLDKKAVLRLNSNWIPIGKSTIRDALTAMYSGDEFLKAATAIDFQYVKYNGLDHVWDFETQPFMIPTPIEQWNELPIRDFDAVIHTAKKAIRIPTVIIAGNYNKVHMVQPKSTPRAIWERDKNICQYTGESVNKNTGNIDHVIPRDIWVKQGRRGSPDNWENMVVSKKEINFQKGNKMNHEIGLKLIKKPKAPNPVPISALIREAKHRDWKWFVH